MNKIYPNGVQAVYDFDAKFEDGEFIVLVGPSGCGKSTMLRMIAGLEEISPGELWHRQRSHQRQGAQRSRHRDGLSKLRALRAYDGVSQHGVFARSAQRKFAIYIHERVMWAANILGLDSLFEPQTAARFRAASANASLLGRAIVRNPKIFLLDEPLSNLDAKLRGIDARRTQEPCTTV
ncbi:MAG: ATP-binding cassette domain-containing protein [Bacillus subtilis]|nr:ATP-binding cassette domain-containing protein [Bacillus subtilis]